MPDTMLFSYRLCVCRCWILQLNTNQHVN